MKKESSFNSIIAVIAMLLVKLNSATKALSKSIKALSLFLLSAAIFNLVFSFAFVEDVAYAVPSAALDPGRVSQRLAPSGPTEIPVIDPLIRTQEVEKKEAKKETTKGTIVSKRGKKKDKELDSIKFKLNRIIIQGGTAYKPEEMQPYYKPYLEKNVSLSDLRRITEAITAHYRNNGYILSRAVIPAQGIKNGVVTIRMIEGFIAEVYIDGDIKGAKKQLEKYAQKIKQMRPLQMKQLERYLLLANDLPGLTVKGVLSPSTTVIGAAELTLFATQRKVAFEASYDNRGSRYMGPQQLIANVEVDDVLHSADRLLLQTLDTPHNDELRFVQLNYQRPFGDNGLRMILNGNLAETNPGFVINKLDLVGRSKSWSIGFDYPLWRTRATNLYLYGKFDWLDSQNNFAVMTLFKDHIRSLRIGLNYNSVDSGRGINTANIELSKGLKIFGASPTSPATRLSRVEGSSDYTKVTATLSRLQSLGGRFSLLGAINGQYSFNDRLLSSEGFSFGGSLYGRGYDPSELVGDSGIAGKLEFRVDTYPGTQVLKQVQYYFFYDAGVIWNNANNYKQANRDSATSGGAGARMNFGKYFAVNVEAAKPLTRKVDSLVITRDNGNSWRFYFGISVKF